MFERKVAIPGHGEVLLRFRDFSLIPGRISRVFTGRVEQQLWQALSWGLTEPKRWPDKPFEEGEPVPPASTAIADGLFDDLPMREVMKIHNEWQNAVEVTEGESDASTA